MVPRWRFLATFLGPAFPASRVQHVSDLHVKFLTKATPCVEVWQTSKLRRLRLGEEKLCHGAQICFLRAIKFLLI